MSHGHAPVRDVPAATTPHPLLRVRDGSEAKVSYAELFFDLVYVFAVTQVSHFLLAHLTVLGAAQALLLWFAVWLGWQYTCWMTNWFDPETRPIRVMLFALMGVGLLFAAALPEAFGERALLFAGCYAVMQVGRALFLRLQLGDHPLGPNFSRILAWAVLCAALWIGGGLAEPGWRLLLWGLAVACEYISPMFGFPVPGLGRSDSAREWTIEGGHLVERCALFVIVALGESILITGATLAHAPAWDAAEMIAFATAFVGSLAMWWLYFNIAVRDATEVIVQADDPGRYGALFHYLHVAIVGSVIVTAVGNDLMIAHPHGHMTLAFVLVMLAGPGLFLAGNGLYKRAVYGRFPLSHLIGLALLLPLACLAQSLGLLWLNALTTVVLIVTASLETAARGGPPDKQVSTH
ncbi:low temperature requirement protein A [Pseudoxanthomonas winnipegensis]|jgi:low temperature requirement protein LtrA|nr:low temperature requirement protein A [Pseudoxanthomonas winnipegensis]TAA08767.1 low temperature requirement protein A [Pseudoxanthomonas winnipegensis]TAH71879.1 low temperature requirement protein A [Pseudoxanthomonas winnipegensis]